MSRLVKYGLGALPVFLKSKGFSSVFVLVDENTVKYCLPLLDKVLDEYILVRIKSGEKNKHIGTCEKIWDTLITKGADRKTILLNLGGGVITDMGGFAASSFMRGIRFINIPTTLLAMADAAIGGKTGVDHAGIKNMVGSFNEPMLVLIEEAFLKTLPQKQLISASSELFKHALLQGKRGLKRHLQSAFTRIHSTERLSLIRNSVNFKLSVVAKDFEEQGLRKQLNLGHTVGHAFESYFLNYGKPLLHGEAVALGLVGEAFIAHRFYGLDYFCFLRIVYWYDLNFIKPNLERVNFNTVLNYMRKDKKNSNASIRMVLLREEGKVDLDKEVSESRVREMFQFIRSF
jgi:3-dehydroquinate synthase